MTVTLSGCVYLRLAEFKNQLASFDKFATIDTGDGLTIRLSKPVLVPSDMEFLLDAKASATTNENDTTVQFWRFRRQTNNTEGTLVSLVCNYQNGRLTAIHMPGNMIAAFPTNFWINLLHHASDTEIDRRKEAGKLAFQSPLDEQPMFTTVESIYGQPDRTTPPNQKTYDFLLDTNQPGTTHPNRIPLAVVTYETDASNRITAQILKFGRFTMRLKIQN